MAKKVALLDEETIESGGIKPKKKRSKCCTSCIAVLIVVLVIFAVALIVGWVIGDKYTKKLFGMSLGDTLGVMSDLYWTDDEDVVKRPFKSSDADGFYSELKRNILLKDSAEIDFEGALNAAVNNYLGVQTSRALNSSAGDSDGGETNGSDTNGGETSGGNTSGDSGNELIGIFTDMIVGALDRDNIDVERLNSYPDTDDYIFDLNDRQLAAFVNIVINSVLINADKIDSLGSVTDLIDLSKVVALKQIRFTAKSQKTDGGAETVTASSADITVWIGLQNAANQAIKKALSANGFGWAGGFVGWLSDVVLPENVYITLSVPLLGEDNAAQITINDMNASERARAAKLINGILKQVGGKNPQTLDGILAQITDYMGRILKNAVGKMDFTNAGSGTVSIDLLETVAQKASENLDGEPLTKADFLYMLQALFSDKTEQLESLTPYRYDNWYLVDGKVRYLASGGNAEDRIDYEQLLIDQIEQKYALDLGESKSFAEVLGYMGISLDGSVSAGSSELLNKVDSDKFKALLDTPDLNDIRLEITDRMLGAVFSDQMDTLLPDSLGLGNLGVKLDALTFIKKANEPDNKDHLYALLAVEVVFKDAIGELIGGADSFVSQLATSLMPDDILLTLVVDITRDRSVTHNATEFVLNSCYNTDRAFAAVEKVLPRLKLNAMIDQIGTMLNDMLDTLDSNLNIVLQDAQITFDKELSECIGNNGALVMPDIFTFISDMVLVETNEDGTTNKIVTSEQFRQVVRDLNNPGEVQSDIADGYGDFIADVFDKYYFNEPDEAITDFDRLTEYLNDFDTNKFRINGERGLARDNRPIDMLSPIMKPEELGALIAEKMQGNSAIESFGIVNVATGEDSLTITVSIGLSDLMSGAEQIQAIISAEELYASVTFEFDKVLGNGTEGDPFRYNGDMTVKVKDTLGQTSDMTDETYNSMLKIVRFFAPEFSIEERMNEFGVILYDQMQQLNSSIGKRIAEDEGDQDDTNDEVLFRFTDNGLEIVNFYRFLAIKMQPELLETSDDTTIKSALQGMYIKPDEGPAGDSNYELSDIIYNAPLSDAKWSDEKCAELVLSGGTYLDSDFNGYLKGIVESIAKEGDVIVEQTIILSGGDRGADGIREWINRQLTPESANVPLIDPDKDYMVITFSMFMEDFLNAAEDSEGAGLYPDRVYATLVFEYDKDAEVKFTKVGDIIFNDMTNEEYLVVLSIMSNSKDTSDVTKVNLVSVTNACSFAVNSLTDYGAIEFAKAANIPDGQWAVGQITIEN